MGASQRGRCGLERTRDGRRNTFGLGDAGKVDQPGAVSVLSSEGGSDLHSQSGLADPAGTNQGHEPAGTHRFAQLLELGLAADEGAHLLPQVAGNGAIPGRSGNLGWTGQRQRRILSQDTGLELTQGHARIDAQLVDQSIPDPGIGPQRLGLPSVPVQGKDEQLPQTLAQRVFPAERLEVANDLSVTAQRQVCFRAGLQRSQGQLAQVCSFGIGEAGIGELAQWVPAPQLERLGESGRRRLDVALAKEPPARGHQSFETDCVDVVGIDGEGIAGLAGENRRRPERAPQLTDLCLQSIGWVGRLPVFPQGVDEVVGRDRPPPVQRQESQQSSLLGAADLHRLARLQHLELAEEPDLHVRHGTTIELPGGGYFVEPSHFGLRISTSVARQPHLRPKAQAANRQEPLGKEAR